MISLLQKIFLLTLTLGCVANQTCYDLPLSGNFQGYHCAQYNSSYCAYATFASSCCYCNGGSATNPVPDNCQDIALPAAWNGSCSSSPYANNYAYCQQPIFQSNCCFCFGGTTSQNSNPCSNCVADNTVTCTASGSSNYTCQCKPGYAGANCEQTVNPCANNNCNTQGTSQCVVSGSSYTCQCNTGFEGAQCQTNINDCTNNECQNNSTCVDGINSYTCTCTSGFTGNFCQTAVNDNNNNNNNSIEIADNGANVEEILNLFGSGNMIGSTGQGTWYDYSNGHCSIDLNGKHPLMKQNINDATTATSRLGVALNAPQYSAAIKSMSCGMCLEARAKPTDASGVDPIPTTWTPVIVQDEFPGGQTGSLDFVRNSNQTGNFDIEWRAVPCPVTETAKHNMQLRFVGANLAYAIKVQVRNHRYPVKSFAILYNNVQYQLQRTNDNHFTNNGVSGLSGPLGFPFTAIICDIYNQCVFTCFNPPIQNKEGSMSSQTIDIDVQFPEKNENVNKALDKPTLMSGQDKRCPDLGGLFGPGCGENCGKWLTQSHHYKAGDKVTHNGTTYTSQGWTNVEPNANVWAWQG